MSARAEIVAVRGASQLLVCDGTPQAPGVLQDAAIGIRAGRVAWVGPDAELPAEFRARGVASVDATDAVVTPGLVEAHTHLVFAGTRADEFALRARGATYEEIAASGGGIVRTVAPTRAATEDSLHALGRARLSRMLARGVTTVELKSGYGLAHDAELKLLRVAARLRAEGPTRVVSTYLGAHTVPADRRDRRAEYLDEVVERSLPEIAREGLADFCDVFVETGAFTADEARRVLGAARALGLRTKLHADQLSSGGGAELAAELGAVSADHLEHVSPQGVRALADAGVTAVLLPAATTFLGKNRLPPARALLDAGVSVALSTDFNPGSCTCANLPLVTTLACSQLHMSVEEALWGITAAAARAVGRAGEVGTLAPGAHADFVLFDVRDYREIPYWFGDVPVRSVWRSGRRAHPPQLLGSGTAACQPTGERT